MDIIKAASELDATNSEGQKVSLYLMIIGGERRWLSLQGAGAAYDNGWTTVSIDGVVFENGKERPITAEERKKIAEIADEHSANK